MQICVNVLFFAKGRELAGTSAERLQVAARSKVGKEGRGGFGVGLSGMAQARLSGQVFVIVRLASLIGFRSCCWCARIAPGARQWQ